MANAKYRVELTADEREEPLGVVGRGKGGASQIKHANTLLAVDRGEGGDLRITDAAAAAAIIEAADIKTAEDWKAAYPDEYASFVMNEENTDTVDYLEEYPYLATLYAGNAFSMSDEDFAAGAKLDREAMFYRDFVFVENSEGAHNSALTTDCLDKAEAVVDEALAMLA